MIICDENLRILYDTAVSIQRFLVPPDKYFGPFCTSKHQNAIPQKNYFKSDIAMFLTLPKNVTLKFILRLKTLTLKNGKCHTGMHGSFLDAVNCYLREDRAI